MSDLRRDFVHAEGCPVCSSRRFHPCKKGNLDFARLHADQVKITDNEYGRTWDLSECGDCGHIFADPSPDPGFILSLYRRVEDPVYDDEAEGRSRNFVGILRNLEGLVPSKGKLFDVGAATGILVRLARDRGWEAQGIEPSTWAAKYAAEKYGLSLLNGSFEDAALRPGADRAVTMIDFIEHTARPREAAAKAAEILAPGGILCLVTPDVHSTAARLAGRRWWHFRPGHLAYFSERSLAILLGDAGLKIVLRRKYAWTFSLHYLLSRKPAFRILMGSPKASSFFKKISLKLALGDSFEIYAQKNGEA